jgi:3-oxoadipate enol-lactonase
MPHAIAEDGTTIAYAVAGARDAEPLLMIHGLGADTRGWIMQKRALASRFRLIMVDNRGVGRSGRPVGPYGIETMAADAMTVLDHAGYGSAHVMGASMGGIISQAIAVRYPDRVRSLVLACTACRHHRWRLELLQDWADEAEAHGMREYVRRNLSWLVGPRSLKRLWPAMAVLGPLAFNVPVESFVAQIEGIIGMDDSLRDELVSVEQPTLVLVGSQDVLTTQGDGEEIASLIPGSELVVLRGGAHLFMVEQAATFNRTVTGFYDRILDQPVRPRTPALADV